MFFLFIFTRRRMEMIDNANNLMNLGRLVAAERIAGINDNMSGSHYHEFYEVYYLESGERYHLIDDKLYLLSPGQFIIFNPYQLHYSYGDENIAFSRLLLYFDKRIITHTNIAEGLRDISGAYQFDHKKNAELYLYLNHILNEQVHKNDYFIENMEHIANQFVIELLRNKSNKKIPSKNNLITKVISYINLNYMKDINLKQISKHFYISQYHLCREFKLYTNNTVIQYINKIRIIHAQKMLFESNKKITVISSEVGFDSLTHFERVFKQTTNMTPSQYRKQNKQRCLEI